MGVSVVRELGLTSRMRGNRTSILISRKEWTKDAEDCIVLIKKKFAECCAKTEDDIRLIG